MDETAHRRTPCNVVLKGGITSGVVYPLTLVELAKKHTFRGIGGTSAGAIAAALTAAAELGRERGGFPRLAEVASDLPTKMRSLFQPAPAARGLFGLLMAMLGRRSGVGRAAMLLLQLPWRFPGTFVLGSAPAVVLALWSRSAGHAGLGLVAALCAFVLVVGLAFALRLAWCVVRTIPALGFGLCPGVRQRPSGPPGLTDWLADLLDEISSRPEAAGPLTFGDLEAAGIELRCFTTCLSQGRPYVLPWESREFLFRPDQFRQLFPARVVEWMEAHSDPSEGDPGLRKWPEAAHLPVIVAVRMSLAFPLLFSAVPLWLRDRGLSPQTAADPLRRVWFSDGGLSSNLPLQLFDHLWPKLPTFAVTLDRFDPQHHQRPGEPETRVWLPKSAGAGRLLPIQAIDSTPGFLGSLLRVAKDWGDSLQAILPGYRERIVHVCLSDEEGGLNLNMPPERIERLIELGRLAGVRLVEEFDADAHRWTRTLSALDRVAGALSALDQETIDYLRQRPWQGPYKPLNKAWAASAADALEALRAVDLAALRPKPVPQPQPLLRLMPRP